MTETYRIEEVLSGVQTLTLRQGDVLAFLAPGRLTPKTHERIREICTSLFPGVKAIVLEEGMTLARVTVEP